MKLRALFEDRRYYATPDYQGVTLEAVDAPDTAIRVAYSDTRLQLQPSWWRWHQVAAPLLTAALTPSQESAGR